jgi:hypothetical protein
VWISFNSDRFVELESYDPTRAGWDYVCTVPCTRWVRTVGVYRVRAGTSVSSPFPVSVEAEPWVVLHIAPDGRASVSDSPSLRAERAVARREAAEAAVDALAAVSDLLGAVAGAVHR